MKSGRERERTRRALRPQRSEHRSRERDRRLGMHSGPDRANQSLAHYPVSHLADAVGRERMSTRHHLI